MAVQIRLELLAESHARELQRLADDPEVSNTSGVPQPCSLEDVGRWIAQNQARPPERLTFAVKADGYLAGACSLRHLDLETRQAELSYWVGRAYWGRGIGAAAATALLDHAFGELALRRVTAQCLKASNERSTRLLRRLGFRVDTEREERPAGGRWGERFAGDVWVWYVLTAEEWDPRRAAAEGD